MQTYAARTLLYVPKEGEEKSWGEVSGYRTYLLFERKNKEFSDGLYLENRYFIGPVKMPLTLFHRSSGPEEQMKWRVDAAVFLRRVQNWTERIADGQTTPPLILEYAEDGIRVNDGRHRLEMYRQLGITKAWAVCWKTREKI